MNQALGPAPCGIAPHWLDELRTKLRAMSTAEVEALDKPSYPYARLNDRGKIIRQEVARRPDARV